MVVVMEDEEERKRRTKNTSMDVLGAKWEMGMSSFAILIWI